MMIDNIKIFLTPFLVMIIVQAIKSVIDARKGEFNWNLMLNYGGMPSGHTALIVSTATVIGLAEGFGSSVFLLAAIIALLTMRDAVGFRAQLSEHAKIINKLIKELPDDREYSYPYSLERLGHTPLQVLVGAIVGILLTLIIYYLI